jgi:hypothetical protein
MLECRGYEEERAKYLGRADELQDQSREERAAWVLGLGREWVGEAGLRALRSYLAASWQIRANSSE